MLPRIILHTAVSVDGRIDWFAPDLEQYYGLISTWKEDATLAGSETILKATADLPPGEDTELAPAPGAPDDPRAILVIPDSRGRVRSWHALKQWGYWKRFVALCTRSTPGEYRDYLTARGVDTIEAGADRVDFRAALEELHARYGMETIRVDSGGVLNGVLLRAGLVDEVSVLVYPSLVGGESPRSLYRAPDLTSVEGVVSARLLDVQRLDGDVIWLRYAVEKR